MDRVIPASGSAQIVGGTSFYNEPGNGFDRGHGYPYDFGGVEIEGLRNARIWDPYHSTFAQAAPMKYGRWYPSGVTMPDGKVMVFSGVTKLIKDTQSSQVRRSETYDPTTNTWTENYAGPQSENSLPLNARVILAPNGRIFYMGAVQMFGPFGQAADEALYALQQFFNPDTRKWEIVGLNPLGARSNPFMLALPMAPPYDRMTLLTYGGDLGPPPGSGLATALAQLTTIDKDGHVTNTMAADLHHARWFASGVQLPDGKVLALNGADRDELEPPGTEMTIRTPELYDPATNTWTDMAPASRDRGYHNAAILLPDGRVLSGGHSPVPSLYGSHHTLMPGVTENNEKDSSFQVWSPPYLFYGPRPRITHAPHGVAWGSTFTISVDDPASIRSVVAMRTSSQQHVVAPNARTLELSFTQTGPHTLGVTAPPTGVVAPPGAYYLFVNRQNARGLTPSVARILVMGSGTDASEAIQPMADDAPPPSGGSATPVVDDSYQHQYAGATGSTLNEAIASPGYALVQRSQDIHVLQAVAGRLTSAVRGVEAAGPVMLVSVLVTLSLGLAIRVRRWLISHNRD